MVGIIAGAVARGYTAHTIVNALVKRFPQHAGKIESAYAAGYTADRILQSIDRNNGHQDADKYLTENEQVRKRDKEQKRNAAYKAVAGIAATSALVGGGAGAISALRQRNRAVYPSQILPAMPQQRGIPNQNRQGIGFTPGQQQGNPPPQQPPQAPAQPRNQPPGPSPRPMGGMPAPQQQQNAQPPAVRNPEKNITLVKNLREDNRVANILKGTADLAIATEALRKLIPRAKVDILDKAEGGLEQVVQDYAKHLQDNPPAIREQFQGLQGQQPIQHIDQEKTIPEYIEKKGEDKYNNTEKKELDQQKNMIDLFHTSPDLIEKIHDDGRFGSSLFFSDKPYYMSQASKNLYKMKADKDKILDINDLRNLNEKEHEKIKPILEKIIETLQVDEDIALDLLSEKKDLNSFFSKLEDYINYDYDEDDSEDKEEKKRLYDFLSKQDLGELQWDMQGLSLMAANALGYEGAELTDEQGTSYLINMKGREKELRLMKNEEEEQNVPEEILEQAKNIVSTPIGPAEIKHDGKEGKIVQTEKGQKSFPHDQVEQVPDDVIQAVSNILQIPEVDRSSNIALFMYNPQDAEMYFQFHNGEAYKYYGIDPEKVFRLANKMSIPITSGQNIFGAWSPEDKKSLGATFYQEILKDPKYKKSKKGEAPNPNYVKLDTLYDYWEKLRKKKSPKKSKETDV